MVSLEAYIPMDRCQAMARGEDLPERTSGAALFADISGFTPLTEALVKAFGPRRAVEELTDQLNRVYGALIAEVYRYGGSVVGFVGDAMTCWFEADVGRRASACGLAMQQALAPFTQLDLPTGGTASLAIKVGIASGPARRFRVGDPQIQYLDVLAGATLQRMALAEQQAQQGEVVLDPQTVANLQGQMTAVAWRTHPESGQRFAVLGGLSEPVTPTPWSPLPPAALSEAQVRPWLLPSVYERLRSGQSHFLAELRPAVALFLKFDGLDYDQDEAAGKTLDSYIRWVQRTISRYEGNLIQLTIGDKGSFLYVAFGAPIAHDDDPVRAVAAALDLQHPPSDLAFIIARIGLAQGPMRVGAYGGQTRCTYGVIGDEAILAARLMSQVGPGQILVSQRMVAAAPNYQFQYLGFIQVKGKQTPLPVSLVLGRRWPTLSGMATRFTTPLVGRDDELAQLEQSLERVLAGQPQLVWLEGAAGVGKSHLVAEFAERAVRRGLRVTLGACQSTSQDIAYTPWQQILRALLVLTEASPAAQQQLTQVETIIGDLNPAWLIRLPLLSHLLNLPIPDNPTTAAFSPQLRQEASFALAIDLLRAWAQTQPLLLLIEDAHWLDEASRSLTLALIRAMANLPLLLVLVHRPPALDDEPQSLRAELKQLSYYRELRLEELPPQAVAMLVRQRLHGDISALAMRLIQVQAHGNPFFVEELVDTLHERGALHQPANGRWTLSEAIFNALRQANCLVRDATTGQWRLAEQAPLVAADLGLPDSIHGAVLSRLDRLPEAHKVTLKVASVIGRSFEFELLAQAHPTQPGQATLLEQMKLLEERDFIRRETPQSLLTYTFKHNITQEVAYNTLLEDQQRELHRAVGVALEDWQPTAVERLAYHYRYSGLRAKMLFYLDQAARKTQGEYANETALNYYQQALALEERWEWRKGQVEVLHILGQREVERTGLEALATAPDAPTFEVAYLWGQYYETIGEYAEAQAAVEQALAASRTQANLVSEVRCLDKLGLIARRKGDYDEAKAWYHQALALFHNQDTYPVEEVGAFVQALNGLGIIYRQQGGFDQAQDCYQRALTLSRMSGNRQSEADVLNGLGVIAFYQRHFAEALSYHQQALRIRRSIGDQAGEGISLMNLAQTALDAGDYSQAHGFLSKALPIHQATGNRWEEINVWLNLGALSYELGQLATAQTRFERALRLSQEIGDEAGQAFALCNLGLTWSELGQLAAAEAFLQQGLRLAENQADKDLASSFYFYLSRVSLQAGRLEQAISEAEAALALRYELDLSLRTVDDLATLAIAHLAMGQLAKALEYTRQMLAILGECGGEGPEFPQRAYFIGYQVLAAAGQAKQAQTALQAAYDVVMTRAAKISDPAQQSSFLEQRVMNREIVAEYELQG